MRVLRLTSLEGGRIGELVDEVLDTTRSDDPLLFADAMTDAVVRLPHRLRSFLAEVRADEIPVSVVSGLPLRPDLEPTPVGWSAAAETAAGRREEAVLLLCSAPLGDAFGWAGQQGGRLVHDICPRPGMERALTSASSAAPLSLHTEDLCQPCRGDYVALFCLRNPDATGTTIAGLDVAGLPGDVADVLAGDRFRFYRDDSYQGSLDTGGSPFYTTGAAVFGPAERPYLRLDTDFMTAEDGDEAAAHALRIARQALLPAVQRVALAPGDAVFVDNYQVLHGRQPFKARFDGRDRWLKRINLIRDIRRAYVAGGSRSRIIGNPALVASADVGGPGVGD